MKRIVTVLSILACGVALISVNALAADKPAKKKACGCCEATVEGGKKCEKCGECCKKAAAEGKVCAKCHPPKKAKKTT